MKCQQKPNSLNAPSIRKLPPDELDELVMNILGFAYNTISGSLTSFSTPL